MPRSIHIRLILLVAAAAALCSAAAAAEPTTRPSAEQALKLLEQGNARFVAGKMERPRANAERRTETVRDGQHPFVTILACSDSRASLDIIFDQGLGDIFTIRVAGNVCDTDEIGSIEYGTDHLGTPLLVVLGHSKCGAVTAVCKGDTVHGSILALVSKIVPAVKKTQAAHPDMAPAELIPLAIEANVWQSIDELFRRSEVVRNLVKDGKLRVFGAVHDLESGKIKWLGEPADLAKLLAYADFAKLLAAAAPAGSEHGQASATAQTGHGEKPQAPATQPAGMHAPAHETPASVAQATPAPEAHVTATPPTQADHAVQSKAPEPVKTVTAVEHKPQPSAAAERTIEKSTSADRTSDTAASSSSYQSSTSFKTSSETSSGHSGTPVAAKAVKAKNGDSGGLSLWHLAGAFVGVVLLGFVALKVLSGSTGNSNNRGDGSMFKNMKLGAKIGAGFAALIVIALGLGGLAVWSMSGVKTIANTLAEVKMKEVDLTTDIERYASRTMYAARGYAYTEDKKFLDAAMKSLEETKKVVEEAKEHGAKTGEKDLEDNATKAKALVVEYEKLLGDTVKATEAMAKDTAAMDDGAKKYMQVCSEFLLNQSKKLDEEIKESLAGGATTQPAGAAAAKIDWEKKLTERVWKIQVCNDVVDLGNAIRIGNWRAQADRDPKVFQEAQKKFIEVNSKLDELKAKTTQEANLKQIEACRAAGNAYNTAMTGFLTNWIAREDIGKKRGETGDGVLKTADETGMAALEDCGKSANTAASSLSTASLTMLIGLGVAVLVGVLMAVFITRSITKPVNRIIAGLTSGSEQTASAAGQVSSASQSLAQGASEQAAAIEETTSSVEEMSSMIKQNAANANEAKTLASNTKDSAEKGGKAMSKMSQAIEDIKQSSDKTAKIVKTIDEIAFQTNLLALNAAVEAARAGEAGKGFAVVAEEVRNLAMRSAEAAKNTATMIEESVKNANNGVVISKEVGESLTEIATSARKVNDLVAEITAASNEQAQGIEQISTAVVQMDSVTQQNAANAEESAAASEELSAQAEELSKMVTELRGLVGGAANAAAGGGTGTKRVVASAKAGGFKQDTVATRSSAKAKAAHSPRSHAKPANWHDKAPAGAEEVIPMEGQEDLAKF